MKYLLCLYILKFTLLYSRFIHFHSTTLSLCWALPLLNILDSVWGKFRNQEVTDTTSGGNILNYECLYQKLSWRRKIIISVPGPSQGLKIRGGGGLHYCGGHNLPPGWDRVNCLAKNPAPCIATQSRHFKPQGWNVMKFWIDYNR